MTNEVSTERAAARAVTTAGRWLGTLLGVALVSLYLAIWVGLAGTHVARGDYVAATISLVVFVLPVVGFVVRDRIKAYELRRDLEIDTARPSP